MKGNSLSILLLCCILFSCSTKQSKEQAIDDIAAKVGTFVNQKWSTYKYKSHFKKTPHHDNSVDMYSRLIKNETGDNYILTTDLLLGMIPLFMKGIIFLLFIVSFLNWIAYCWIVTLLMWWEILLQKTSL